MKFIVGALVALFVCSLSSASQIRFELERLRNRLVVRCRSPLQSYWRGLVAHLL